ncbi:glycogen debranching enzyme [compost metagenome]
MDGDLVQLTADLAAMRKRFPVFAQTAFFSGENGDVEWISASGETMTVPDWEAADGMLLGMVLKTTDGKSGKKCRLAALFNRDRQPHDFRLPAALGAKWRRLRTERGANVIKLKPRSVEFFIEY